ncbi:MAG: GumC family protein, partial [Candidatus Omnitrophota bacterium]
MPEYGLNIWDYLRIIYKRKWIIISVFLVSIVSSHFFTEKAEPIYKSSVTLHFDTGRTPIAEVTGAGVTFWGAAGERISTQIELIKSYTILREVALHLGYITPETDSDKVQAMVASLRGQISVEEKPGTDLIVISTIDRNPLRAKNITETVANIFIEKNWEKKIEQARKTKIFVEKQLEKLNKSITDIKKKLQFLGVEPGVGRAPAGVIDLKTRLVQLKFELSYLRERYTDNYPKIVDIKAEIDSISRQL